ncbi:MAG TPA: hypothetical protein VF265_02690 [Nevskiaceae bacterium]
MGEHRHAIGPDREGLERWEDEGGALPPLEPGGELSARANANA